MPTYLLSDLHLTPGPSRFRERFLAFLDGRAREADAVYLLGDLFESWIGDDAGLRAYPREVSALAKLTERGVRTYFQRGNRDFLVGRDFARVTGATLLPDPIVVDLHGTPTLLSHGDVLCTDDAGYQRWRRFSRNPAAQWLFLKLPRGQRERIAGGLRNGSDAAKSRKAADIMDVNEAAVRSALAAHGVRRIVHGHTHRPGRYEVPMGDGGPAAERMVLADWRPDRTEAIEASEKGLRRVAL